MSYELQEKPRYPNYSFLDILKTLAWVSYIYNLPGTAASFFVNLFCGDPDISFRKKTPVVMNDDFKEVPNEEIKSSDNRWDQLKRIGLLGILPFIAYWSVRTLVAPLRRKKEGPWTTRLGMFLIGTAEKEMVWEHSLFQSVKKEGAFLALGIFILTGLNAVSTYISNQEKSITRLVWTALILGLATIIIGAFFALFLPAALSTVTTFCLFGVSLAMLAGGSGAVVEILIAAGLSMGITLAAGVICIPIISVCMTALSFLDRKYDALVESFSRPGGDDEMNRERFIKKVVEENNNEEEEIKKAYEGELKNKKENDDNNNNNNQINPSPV